MAGGAAGVVIEIAEDGRHLALDRGFMVVKGDGREIGRVPLDDLIGARLRHIPQRCFGVIIHHFRHTRT